MGVLPSGWLTIIGFAVVASRIVPHPARLVILGYVLLGGGFASWAIVSLTTGEVGQGRPVRGFRFLIGQFCFYLTTWPYWAGFFASCAVGPC
jgi:hypothetical protein